MKEIFTRDETSVFRDLMGMAKAYSDYCKAEETDGPINIDDIDAGKGARAAAPLVNFLNSLDFEMVKTIQCIMYLGRDQEYELIDESDVRLEKQRKYFDSLDWHTKDVEVDQMVGKGGRLYEYLANGFSILEMSEVMGLDC